MTAVAISMNATAFRCQYCRWNRHCDDSNPAPAPIWKITSADGEVEERTTCPLPTLTPQSVELLKMYRYFQNNNFPNAGGWLDQPNAFLRAMEVIGAEITHHEEMARDRKKH